MANVGGPQFRRGRTGAVPTDIGRQRLPPMWLWLLLALLALLALAWLLYVLIHKTHSRHSAAPGPAVTASATAAPTPSPKPTPASSNAVPPSPTAIAPVPVITSPYAAALVGGAGLPIKPATGVEAAAGPAGGSTTTSTGPAAAAGGPQGTVLFASGSAALDAAGLQVIKNAAARIKALHPAAVTVTGYTDVVGGQPKNNHLSLRRADAVAAVLRQDLVAGPPVTATAKGEADPIAPNATAAGRQANRRASITTN